MTPKEPYELDNVCLGALLMLPRFEIDVEKEIKPILTVAMPLKDRAWCIGKVLDSLLQQDYLKECIQVVFIDGFSTDGTYESLADWAGKHGDEYAEVLVLRRKSNIPEARNVCLQNSKGDFILFWDSDVVAPPNGIATLFNDIKGKDVGVSGLPYDVDKPSLFDLVYRAREPLAASSVDAVSLGFTMLRREAVLEVGSFNERLRGYEDLDYCLRTKREGYKIIFDPTVRCNHLKPEVFISGRYKEKKGVFDYPRFLWFNFTKAPDYLTEVIRGGSRTRFLKTVYYFFSPMVLIVAFVSLVTLSPILAIFCFAYLGLAVVYHLRKTRGLFYGLAASAIFISGGVALAYGIAVSFARRALNPGNEKSR